MRLGGTSGTKGMNIEPDWEVGDMRYICVQAKDGRWNFGPVIEEQIMRDLPTGDYANNFEARDALLEAATKEWRIKVKE